IERRSWASRPRRAIPMQPSVRTLGGTVRGDDQPSRCPPLGVWFGIILAIGIGRVLLAQDGSDPTPARQLNDPIELVAQQEAVWKTPDGEWVHLFGASAVFQGAEGIRAQEAVARVTSVSSEEGQVSQVEVYAEGRVTTTGAPGLVLPRLRAV